MSRFGIVLGVALAGFYLARPLVGQGWAAHVAALGACVTAVALMTRATRDGSADEAQ